MSQSENMVWDDLTRQQESTMERDSLRLLVDGASVTSTENKTDNLGATKAENRCVTKLSDNTMNVTEEFSPVVTKTVYNEEVKDDKSPSNTPEPVKTEQPSNVENLLTERTELFFENGQGKLNNRDNFCSLEVNKIPIEYFDGGKMNTIYVTRSGPLEPACSHADSEPYTQTTDANLNEEKTVDDVASVPRICSLTEEEENKMLQEFKDMKISEPQSTTGYGDFDVDTAVLLFKNSLREKSEICYEPFEEEKEEEAADDAVDKNNETEMGQSSSKKGRFQLEVLEESKTPAQVTRLEEVEKVVQVIEPEEGGKIRFSLLKNAECEDEDEDEDEEETIGDEVENNNDIEAENDYAGLPMAMKSEKYFRFVEEIDHTKMMSGLSSVGPIKDYNFDPRDLQAPEVDFSYLKNANSRFLNPEELEESVVEPDETIVPLDEGYIIVPSRDIASLTNFRKIKEAMYHSPEKYSDESVLKFNHLDLKDMEGSDGSNLIPVSNIEIELNFGNVLQNPDTETENDNVVQNVQSILSGSRLKNKVPIDKSLSLGQSTSDVDQVNNDSPVVDVDDQDSGVDDGVASCSFLKNEEVRSEPNVNSRRSYTLGRVIRRASEKMKMDGESWLRTTKSLPRNAVRMKQASAESFKSFVDDCHRAGTLTFKKSINLLKATQSLVKHKSSNKIDGDGQISDGSGSSSKFGAIKKRFFKPGEKSTPEKVGSELALPPEEECDSQATDKSHAEILEEARYLLEKNLCERLNREEDEAIVSREKTEPQGKDEESPLKDGVKFDLKMEEEKYSESAGEVDANDLEKSTAGSDCADAAPPPPTRQQSSENVDLVVKSGRVIHEQDLNEEIKDSTDGQVRKEKTQYLENLSKTSTLTRKSNKRKTKNSFTNRIRMFWSTTVMKNKQKERVVDTE